MLNTCFDNSYTLNLKGKIYALDTPKIMGIINVTEDSFFKKSRVKQVDEAVNQAVSMIRNGADIVDIGGMSSRPGATISDADAELKAVLPVVEALIQKMPGIIISIDTIHSKVAEKCLSSGACIINDISAGNFDPDIIKAAAEHRAPFIAMHMPGKPATMQKNAHYADVTTDLLEYFSRKCTLLFKQGVHDVIIDPGFGFGKTIQHNYTLLKELEFFKMLRCPLLVGVSRKSMIYNLLESDPENALNGTAVINTIALLKGAHILRVHDVKEAVEARTLTRQVL